MATLDEVYSEIRKINDYFSIDSGFNNTQDNTNSINSFIVMFFRVFLYILYQSLCYVSHLSRNFSERQDYYNLTYNSSKLHIDVDFSTSSYVSWFTSGFSSEFFTAEIIDCVHPGDDHLGGRILNDSVNYNSQNGLLEFRFAFEVFCPFLNVSDFASDFFSGFSSDMKKSIFELLLKNLFLLKSVSFKQDADLKQTHSKGFLQFLTGKLKDNSDSFVNQLNLSESILNAQTELELPSPSQGALALYTGGVSTLDWLTDLLSLFLEFLNNLLDYSQTSKIDQLLECNFDSKKFNRLLGDALNYARSNENSVLVKRNDQSYIDLNPDGQASLDWDGGLPAVANHRHYDFQSFFQFLGKKSDGSDDLEREFYLSKELVKFLQLDFLYNF